MTPQEAPNPLVLSELRDRYDELLSGPYLESTQEHIERAIAQRRLFFAGNPICQVLRPMFLDGRTYHSVLAAAELVSRGLTILAWHLAREESLRRELGLGPLEESLLGLEPGAPSEVMGRLDGFLSGAGKLCFIEYNSMASGIVDNDDLGAAFAAAPILQTLGKRYHLRSVPVKGVLLDAVLAIYRRQSGEGARPPGVAIVRSGPPELFGLLESELGKAMEALAAGGCAIRYAAPEQLEPKQGMIYVGDMRVDMVLVLDWPSFLLTRKAGDFFFRALREGAVCLANSVEAILLRGNKLALALLSDPRYAGLFTPEIAAALQRHMPWTRPVREGWTTWQSEEIDLIPFVLARREELVLKPASEYGGKGVVLGWACDDEAWQAALRAALHAPHVVQARVAIGSERFPSMVDRVLRQDEYSFDLCPAIWDNQHASGCMVRISRGGLMNMSSGAGSQVPLFLVDTSHVGIG